MGSVYHGIHKRLALQLKRDYELRFFVETGTSVGATAAWAAGHFERVYTIELDEGFHERARKRHDSVANIEFLLGDSRVVLPRVLSRLEGAALFWLDAHWSADLRYPRPLAGECPLMTELDTIVADGRPHVLLIDDARQFVGRPPKPHLPDQWPTFDQIIQKLSGYSLAIQDDVIVGIPR